VFNTFWTDTELNIYINEALRVWGSLTGYWRSRAAVVVPGDTVPISYATTQYVATDCFAVLRIDNAALAHLDPIQLQEIGDFFPNWRDPATFGATASARAWVPIGLNLFALYPQGSAGADTSTFTFDYIYFAPLPASDGAYIQVSEDDMGAIIDYIQFVCALKEGGVELKEAIPLLQSFLSQAAKYNSKLTQSAAFRKLLGMPAGGQVNQRPARFETPTVR
jgi:hypothetical protein